MDDSPIERNPSAIAGRLVNSSAFCKRVWLSFLVCFAFSGVDGGRTEISWPMGSASDQTNGLAVDVQGDYVVCGCTSTGFVTKFSSVGEKLWTQMLDFLSSSHVTSRDCALAIATDADANIYVTGTTGPETDIDIFLLKLDVNGQRQWQQTIGTPQPDHAVTIRVDVDNALYVGGYSNGNLSLGQASLSNCPSHQTRTGCEDGYVLKADAENGAIEWIHHMSSPWSNRIFDLDAHNHTLVVVGETLGELSPIANATTGSHAGDLFVRCIDSFTGKTIWTTQIGSADVLTAERCRFPPVSQQNQIQRGNCGVALVGPSLYVTGTSSGLVSTFPTEIQQHQMLCPQKRKNTGRCMQTVVVKLDVPSGHVIWTKQIVSKAHNNGERIVRSPPPSSLSMYESYDSGVLLLSLTDAGFLTIDRMQQLLVMKVSAAGETEWMVEIGRKGEDRAGPLATSTTGLVVFGSGNNGQRRQDSSRSSFSSLSSTWASYLYTVNPWTGRQVPFCVDSFAFLSNATLVQQSPSRPLLVVVPVTRQRASCGAGSISYITKALSARPDVDYVATGGVVQFSEHQLEAQITLQVLTPKGDLDGSEFQATRSFLVEMEATEDEATSFVSTASVIEIVVEMVDMELVQQATSGAFWQQLTRMCSLSVMLGLLVLLCGRRFCDRCFRHTKVFQYKMIKLRTNNNGGFMHSSLSRVNQKERMSANARMADTDEEAEEDMEKLCNHVAEIQDLNASLQNIFQFTITKQRRCITVDVNATIEEEATSRTSVMPMGATSPRRATRTKSIDMLLLFRPIRKTKQ